MDDRLRIQTAQNVELALAPAGVGDRVLAWLADAVVWASAAGLTLFAVGDALGPVLLTVLVVLPVFLYDLLFEVFWDGQTPGKRLLQLRVARLDGAHPTLAQFGLRWLLRWIDVTFSSGSVALIAVAATKHAQRLGDVAAGTTVVKTRRRLRLADVLYPAAPAGHVPAFPDASRLSDADVRTVRAVLVRLSLARRDARARAIADRAKKAIEARLGLEPVAMPAEAFLEAVVRDHTAVLDAEAA